LREEEGTAGAGRGGRAEADAAAQKSLSPLPPSPLPLLERGQRVGIRLVGFLQSGHVEESAELFFTLSL
jgi:hypothetical protein